MMNRIKYTAAAVLGLLIGVSCSKDDNNGPAVDPPIPFDESALTSKEILTSYLSSHFYNYEEFQEKPAGFDYKIKFDTLAGSNADKTPLIDQVITKTLVRGGVEHELYVLVAREGLGPKPHFADSVFVNYSGNVPYKSKFDFSVTPVWFDLAAAAPAAELYTQAPNALDGFANAMPEFGTAKTISEAEDGSITYSNDYGIGAVFIPTGLAYYNLGSGKVSAYDDLIFKIDLISYNETDHDRDGIPSYMEDINNNNYVYDFGDDTDGDRTPNFLDVDDDGDGILTRDEIVINEDGSITFTDSNNDGTPDYLDPDN